jgi:amino acid adenylation domain-containing protein
MGLCLHILGPLDVDLFKRAVNKTINGSPIFRLNFCLAGEDIVQYERSDGSQFQVDEKDVSQLEKIDLASFVTADAQACLNAAFSLQHDILVRSRVYRCSASENYVLFTQHHGISDAYSVYLQFQKIAEAYNALQSRLPLNASIGSETNATRPESGQLESSLNALRRFIDGAPEGAFNAATDATSSSWRYRSVIVMNDAERESLQRCAKRLDLRMSALSLVHFALVRARVRGQRQFVITLPLSGRTRFNKQLLGCFVNVLPLFIDLERFHTIDALCADVNRQLFLLMRHQDLTIEDHAGELFRMETLGVMRQIYNAVFTYYSNEVVPNLPHVTTELIPLASPNYAYPIGWVTWDLGKSIHIEINSSSEIYQTSDMEGHVRAVAAAFDTCTTIDEILRHGATTAFHRQFFAQTEVSASTINADFALQVKRSPDLIAVKHQNRNVTYNELDTLATNFAAGLASRLDPAQKEVIVCMDRGPELIAAILGILKTGRAYVPLEPATPVGRIDFVVEDLGAPTIVTRAEWREKFSHLPQNQVLLFDDVSTGNSASTFVPSATNPEDSAYVIFTSGSSGRPKGVWVSHGNVTRLFSATDRLFGFGEADVWLLFHSCAFDFSVWEMFGALLRGGCLVIADNEDCKNFDKIADLVIAEGVTVLNQTPTAFGRLSQSILSHPRIDHMALRRVIFGGERLDPQTLADWVSHVPLERTRLTNMYGITETTVHVTHHDITEKEITETISNIGRPIEDLSLYILSDSGVLAQVGQIGEIAVAGGGVSKGYLADAAQAAKVFVANPIEPSRFRRMYRTGDLACYMADGTVQYLGRRDKQVQLRGYRVELSEIEVVLLQVDGIRACSVGCPRFHNGEQRLVAYYVTDRALGQSFLRDVIAKKLPAYMVPSHFVALDALPLTVNGKVDQGRLEADFFAGLNQSVHVTSSDNVDDLAASIEATWATVLGHAVPTHDTCFFDAGGDSLMVNELAIRLKSLLPEGTALQLSVPTLLDRPTIKSQAQFIRSLITGARIEPIVIRSRAQQRLQSQQSSNEVITV